MTMGIDHLPKPCDLIVGGAAEAKAARLEAELNALKHAEARIHEVVAGQSRAQRNRRKPSISTLITQAEKQGKTVTGVTTRDGTVLHFGEPQPTGASNPWLAELDKLTKR
jgi:hypothetical protein